MDDCGGRSPVQQAHRLGLLQPGFLAVHVNYLAPGDAELLGQNKCSVVHCPRSHEYFGHDPFPLHDLRNAGVNICLGTDSLASARIEGGKIPTLNLWDEVRVFAREFPDIEPTHILQMITSNSGQALAVLAGDVAEKRLPDFVAIPAKTLEEAITGNSGNVRTFIAGLEV
jgi:aminodeoxyfutalosine deaminase